MNRIAGILLLVLVLAPAVSAEAVILKGTLRAVDAENPAPFGTGHAVHELSAKAPEGAAVAPKALLDPRYAVHVLAGKKLTIAVGRSSEEVERPDVVWLDGDGDGIFAETERRTLKTWVRNQHGLTIRGGTAQGVPVRIGGREHHVDIRIFARPGQTPMLRLGGAWCLEAPFDRGEARLRVFFQDADADGEFGGSEDRWIVVPDEPVKKPLRWYEVLARDEGCFLAGNRIAVRALRGVEIGLDVRAAEGPDESDLDRVRRRIERTWARKFEESREAFTARNPMDGDRPRASVPLTWLHVPFERAQARSKLTGKPLLVDLRAFWNGRSYLLESTTYRDAEVARVLGNRFVLAQVIKDQDPAGDHPRLLKELRSRPHEVVLGVWSPDGKLIHVIRGWMRPTDLLMEIDKVFEKLRRASPAPVPEPGDED